MTDHLSQADDAATRALLALVDQEIADQVALIAAERARLAEAEKRHTATMGRLYGVRAALTPRTQEIALWLGYREVAHERNSTDESAEQLIRRKKKVHRISERSTGRRKVFPRTDLEAAGVL